VTGDPFAELEAVREEVLAEAERFVEELEPILGASLRSGFERLTIAQADHASRMDDSTRIALEAAVGRATEIGVAGLSVATAETGRAAHGARSARRERAGLAEWLPAGGQDVSAERWPSLGDLDDPSN
jgi:hypothetical protein